jgi:OTU-like cysteine protease
MQRHISQSLVFAAPPVVPVPERWSLPVKPVRLPALAWNPPPARGGVRADASAQHLRVVQIRGDGRCLFRAIARGIAHAERRQINEALEREDADALRGMAWKSMCVDRRKEFESQNIVEGNFSNYCQQMRSPSFFAGEAEMLALSDSLRIPIAVYLQDRKGGLRNIATYGGKYTKLRKLDMTVRVLYNGTNHYNSVLPV